jgi:hypothetical protein
MAEIIWRRMSGELLNEEFESVRKEAKQELFETLSRNLPRKAKQTTNKSEWA